MLVEQLLSIYKGLCSFELGTVGDMKRGVEGYQVIVRDVEDAL